MDKRFQGRAVGVGTSSIIGRIHLVNLDISGSVLPCNMRVMEDNKCDLIFGLDNLKRHECSIDLVSNKLYIKSKLVSVPFLR